MVHCISKFLLLIITIATVASQSPSHRDDNNIEQGISHVGWGLAMSLFSACGLAILAAKVRERRFTKRLLEIGKEATATLRAKREVTDGESNTRLEFDVEFPVDESVLVKKTFPVLTNIYKKYDPTIATAESAPSTMSVHYLEKDPRKCTLSEVAYDTQTGCIVGPFEIVFTLVGLAAAIAASTIGAAPLIMVGFSVGIALSAVWNLPILLVPSLEDLNQLPQFACCLYCDYRDPKTYIGEVVPAPTPAPPGPMAQTQPPQSQLQFTLCNPMPQQQQHVNLINVQVPAGCMPGAVIQVQHPTNGGTIQMTVPPNVMAGQMLQVRY